MNTCNLVITYEFFVLYMFYTKVFVFIIKIYKILGYFCYNRVTKSDTRDRAFCSTVNRAAKLVVSPTNLQRTLCKKIQLFIR